MADDTVKLGSMEIEIITNADKAGEEMQKMGAGSILAIGALGGVIGAVGTAMLGFTTSIIRSAPNVDTGLSKIATGIELIGINSNESFNWFDKLADSFLEFSKDADLNDVLNKRFVFEPDDLGEIHSHYKDFFDGLSDLMPDWMKDGFGIGLEPDPTPIRKDRAGVQQEFEETSRAYPKLDMAQINPYSQFNITVNLDGKELYGQSTYIDQ